MIKNLGLIKAIFVGTTAPSNQNVIWRDTYYNVIKYYDTNSLLWQPIGPPKLTDDAAADAAFGGSAPSGSLYYNTTTNKFRGKEGASWVNLV